MVVGRPDLDVFSPMEGHMSPVTVLDLRFPPGSVDVLIGTSMGKMKLGREGVFHGKGKMWQVWLNVGGTKWLR